MQELPSDELRESVEAVAVIFGSRPEFGGAQARLMPKEGAFRERLLAFDKGQVPASARTRLRKFLAGEATEPLAATLRQWVTALVRYEAANAEAEMVREQTSCTPAMQAGCECLCDLHGMHNVEDDLRGALLMAARFKDAPPAAMEDETEDEEVVRLQEKSNTLKKFVSLMEEGLKGSAKEVPLLQETIKNQLEFNYQYTGVPDFVSYLTGPDGRGTESHAMQSTVMALARATVLISKPAVVHSGGEGRALQEAIVGEIQKSFNEMIVKISAPPLARARSRSVAPLCVHAAQFMFQRSV